MENTWLQLRKVLRNKYKLNNFSRLHALIEMCPRTHYDISREGGH